ncbi:ABC transporter permease [Chitinophaga japonensis]|uniref:ABC-type antimicrobial peptide transport system permease subunit n=1 Tax=Chitinophaga japonensis TaxID=104662 RepID=A0A562SYM3_CHIJA|nr:ABC transporter permease [Chitinophaga japonensis]TWI86429.1 ABC-type antimicrobial peptide transport system permease subunit [Chitinophaga japonensis]
MLKNYLKTAFRNLLKNRLHAFINITGLAAGMAVAMLIGLWIRDELTYDRYNKNYDRIAQVMQNQSFNGSIRSWTAMPYPVGEAVRNNCGNYFSAVIMSSWTQTRLLSAGEKKFIKEGNFMEPQGPEMLDLQMISGSRTALDDPHSILLSASLAKTFFGDADPLGKIIRVDNKQDVKVAGVFKDLPHNSAFADMTFMAPWKLMLETDTWIRGTTGSWGSNSFQLFVQVADHVSMEQASAVIRDLKRKYISEAEAASKQPVLFLHPMREWHLYESFENGVNTGGRIELVWLFGIIGGFVLLLACINFMNLSTARSEKRAKEVGIRKTIGSLRGQLVAQFFIESLLVVMLALGCSLLLVQLLLPVFNDMAGKQVHIPWSNPLFWTGILSGSLLTGLMAGSYPALYLSAFRPVKVLKGTFRAGRWAAMPRKMLVVGQFTVSIILIIGTIIVFRQVQHARDRPMGYNYDRLVMMEMLTYDIYDHFATIRQELQSAGAVTEMALSSSPVTESWSTEGDFTWEGKDPAQSVDFPFTIVSYEFGKTVGWRFREGRDFSAAFATDSAAFVINESAVRFMGLEKPVGAVIKWGGKPYTVIGVIRDMITESPYRQVRPSIFAMTKPPDSYVILKLDPKMSARTALAKIGAVFKQYSPAQPFDYQFVDEEYARKFDTETRIGKLASSFAILAIFISCLGLFGMALFMAEQRTKEIGIRKVLGASVLNLWHLLSGEFLLLVLIALVIAAPIAYYGMQRWLEGYEYRTAISWWIFAATGIGALLIALVTVSGQSVRAALINPVKSLRTE